MEEKMKIKGMATLTFLVAAFFTIGMAWAENIVIKGSTTVLPIAQKVSEAYMKQNPNIKISISGGGSGNGMKALIDGSTDIADSSRFIKEARKSVWPSKTGFIRCPLRLPMTVSCRWSIPRTPSSISPWRSSRTFTWERSKTGKRWAVPDRPVVVISRDTSSGTYEVWHKKVMKKERVYPGALLQASNGAVSQAVAKNKNAIGYIGVGYLNQDVKALMVNRIVGSAETTLNGTYPISRPLFMFTPGWPKGDVLNFINFMLNPEKGQKYVAEAGYVPLF